MTLVVAFALATAGPPASGGLVEAAARIAAAARAASAREGGAKVRVGFFDPLPVSRSESTGAAIEAELVRALGDLHADDGGLAVKGTYQLDTKDGLTSVNIRSEVGRADGRPLAAVPPDPGRVVVDRVSDLARLVPTSVTLPAADQGDYEKVNRRLFLPPTGAADGTLARPSLASDYGVEVRAAPAADPAAPAVPRAMTAAGGKPFAALRPGDRFDLRVVNRGPHPTLVGVSLDGLDLFTFSEDVGPDNRPRFPGWHLPAGTPDRPAELVVAGWHKRYDPAAGSHSHYQFLLTEFAHGAVSKFPTRPRGRVGLIELHFAHAHPPEARRGGAVGVGPVGARAGKLVEFVPDPPCEFLAVRYQR